MDTALLKRELEALLSDKTQESDYLSSVHNQFQKIKVIWTKLLLAHYGPLQKRVGEIQGI